MERKDIENKIKELEDQLKEKLLERGKEISDQGQHDNAAVDSLDIDICILKDRIIRFKRQLMELKEKI